MANVCRHSPTVQNIPASTSGADVTIYQDVVALTLRVVDATGAPIAFTIARADAPATAFHFRANEAWDVQDLQPREDLKLKVTSAAGTIELLTWE